VSRTFHQAPHGEEGAADEPVRLDAAREIARGSAATHALLEGLREAKWLPRHRRPSRRASCSGTTRWRFGTTKEEGLAWTVQSKALRETYGQIFGMVWSVSRKMETEKGNIRASGVILA
jgi:hypothetical protein